MIQFTQEKSLLTLGGLKLDGASSSMVHGWTLTTFAAAAAALSFPGTRRHAARRRGGHCPPIPSTMRVGLQLNSAAYRAAHSWISTVLRLRRR